MRTGFGSSDNAKIGWARWLEKAGREGGSAVLSSSFGAKTRRRTSNIELPTLNIESGRARAGRSLFTSFCCKLEAEHRKPSPGCSVRLARKPRCGLDGTKKLEGKKIGHSIFLSANHGRCKALGRRNGSAPRGRNIAQGCSVRLVKFSLSAINHQLHRCSLRFARIRASVSQLFASLHSPFGQPAAGYLRFAPVAIPYELVRPVP